MIRLGRGIVRLLLACAAIVASVVLGFALVAAAVYVLLRLGVP